MTGGLINDAGTMAMTNVDTVSTYFASHSVGGGNIVTTGALDSGSITSGFGAIDNGTSGIRTNTFTAETSIVPDASGGADIGTTSLEWGDIFIADDKAIKFGSGQDVSMEYDEDGTDSLLISGGDVTIVDDKKLYFGTGQDVYLEYDEDGTDKLIIKGNTTFLDGAYDFDIASHDTSTGLKLGGTLVSATAAELNYSDLATLGTSAASKILSADANNLTKITGAIYIEEATLSFDATQDWDVRASPVAKVTLTANVTFDAPSNPTNEARENELVSKPFVIANSTPVVTLNSAHVEGRIISLPFVAKTQGSTVYQAEYAVNAGDWYIIFPEDGIADSTSEYFTLILDNLKKGEHTIAVRVIDSIGNITTTKKSVSIN